MAQRFLLAVAFTFGAAHPTIQSLCLTTLCVSWVVLHTVVSPLRNPYANSLQTALLYCLALVSLNATPFADAASMSTSLPSAVVTFTRAVKTVGGLVLPAVAVVWAFVCPVIATRWRQRREAAVASQ